MMEVFLTGVLLGLGAAIPLGPVNMEIIRRNLCFGFSRGTMMGAGACAADLFYLILLSLGILSLSEHPGFMQFMGIGGSLVLGWFGIRTFQHTGNRLPASEKPAPTLWGSGIGGFAMTLISPFTILFWASVSARIAAVTVIPGAVYFAGSGVIVGTFAWVLLLNLLIHYTRHLLDDKMIRLLNYSGGIILLGFAVSGLIKAF